MEVLTRKPRMGVVCETYGNLSTDAFSDEERAILTKILSDGQDSGGHHILSRLSLPLSPM
eukprot:6487259-Amphidinium_carterae.1